MAKKKKLSPKYTAASLKCPHKSFNGKPKASANPPHSRLRLAVKRGHDKPATLYQAWVDARKRFHLSHAHIQMARELGLNPKKLGKLANHKQQPWKAPLPAFIEKLYAKRFGKNRPDNVRSIEQIVKDKKRKKAERKELKRRDQQANPPDAPAV